LSQIVQSDGMRCAMVAALDVKTKAADRGKHHEALFDALATVLALSFTLWLAAQQVSLVLGTGPIPTFAPPLVPAGPVVAGQTIAAPGHLLS
jgi:hypothetical protein